MVEGACIEVRVVDPRGIAWRISPQHSHRDTSRPGPPTGALVCGTVVKAKDCDFIYVPSSQRYLPRNTL